MNNVDIAIIGGGIVGTSILAHLFEEGFTGSVVLIEKEAQVGNFTTAYSAGAFRNLWSTDINIEMTNFSIKEYKNFKEKYNQGIGFNQHGYLFTYYKDAWEKIKTFYPEWKGKGVNASLLTPEDIEKLVKGLKTGIEHIDPDIVEFAGFEPIAGGVLGTDCGSFDPSQAATGYLNYSKHLDKNLNLMLNTEAANIVFENNKVKGIRLTNNEIINTENVILAAGPYSKEILKRSNVSESENIPVEPVKRMLYVTNPPYEDFFPIPLVIVDFGIYFKEESGNLLIGRAKESQKPGFDLKVENSYYRDEINPYLQERIPSMAHCNLKSSWAGLYSVTTPDNNGILGEHPYYKGLYLAVGWSGHGAMEAPAIGKALSELILYNEYKTIKAQPLSFTRFKNNQLIVETIVI